ncbi:hypothetical protein AACH06_14675 [Ideonella sp. DXS29W]|uniref:Alpha/beta hydrolase n=1 Tax=Ideonella lacteola TaxID=2984193 RepID=A0ABU9BUB1_9BURK
MDADAPQPQHDGARQRPVRRRHVLYLSGFDPQGPAHYHALYAAEAAQQARASGYLVSVGKRYRLGTNAAWDVHWTSSGESVETCYEFLRWDDIVRAHWPRGQGRLLRVTLATTARLIWNGSLWRIWQTSWPAFLALAMPAALVASGGAVLVGLITLFSASVIGAVGGWGAITALALAWPLAHLASVAQRKVQMAWLMRSASVVIQQARGRMPALELRLDAFAQRLLDVCRMTSVDEVLVIGHSSGAMLAASVVARALRRDPSLAHTSSKLSMLTLGECIPLLSYQPEAHGFRDELAVLRSHLGLNWVDVTAPPDGCCFALVDPTEVVEDGLPESQRRPGGPKRVSPRFAQCFSPETYVKVRRDKYRCHFQYLMAVERPGTYDFFLLSAGPQTLQEKFAHQPPVLRFDDFRCFGGPRR